MPDLYAYTDGACSGNPGPGGWGVLMLALDGDTVLKERELCGGEMDTTNNRMELLAAISALDALERRSELTIVTDSSYVKDGLTKWIIDPESERVLGCGIVGSGAGELIAEAALAIEMGCVIRDVTETVHAHPTLSETMMNAGEVFYGTATEIYKPKKKPAHS